MDIKEMGMDLSGPVHGPLSGVYEHGNELCTSLRCLEFLE
jgi:hypothetical protein